MSMEFVELNTNRSGYTPKQCDNTMTVKQLIQCLEQFDEDLPVYFSNDGGYTYGSIEDNDVDTDIFEEEEEEE